MCVARLKLYRDQQGTEHQINPSPIVHSAFSKHCMQGAGRVRFRKITIQNRMACESEGGTLMWLPFKLSRVQDAKKEVKWFLETSTSSTNIFINKI